MQKTEFHFVACMQVILVIGSVLMGARYANAEPNNEPFENYAKQKAFDYLAEFSERRRLNTFFRNEQSPFYGVQMGYTNVREGNLTFVVRDLVRLDRIPIVFGRVYDSRIENGDFGPGWKLTVTETIKRDGNDLIYTDASNSSYVLVRDGKALKSRYPHITGISRGRIHGDEIQIEHLGLTKSFSKSGDAYRISGIRDRFGNELSVEYEGGRVSKISTESGRFVSIARNKAGLILRAKDDLGRVVRFRYKDGLLSGHFDLGGNKWSYDYAQRMLRSVTDPRGAIPLKAKYSAGKVASVRVQHDSYSFKYLPDRTRVANAMQQSATFWHHRSGLTESAEDFVGAATRIRLDENLNPRSLTYQGTLVASLEYDGQQLAKLTRHDGSKSTDYRYSYSGGRLRSVELDGVRIAAYNYDRNGTVRRAFDSAGQRHYMVLRDGRISSVELDGSKIVLMPNGIGGIGGFSVDGKTLATIEYDNADRVAAIRVRDQIATYEYVSTGFRGEARYGEDGHIDFVYDAVGNLTASATQFDGRPLQESTYAVGPRNQIRSVETSPGEKISFEYDSAGRVSALSQGQRYAEISRDDAGRVNGLIIDDDELFTIDYSPMQIDALVASDVKSNRVRTDSPMVSHIFGSLEAIAYARPRGSPYGLIKFEPSMARFVVSANPYIAPDSTVYSSLTRRAVTVAGKETPFNVLEFDKPSNSLFIPPEFYSANCYICVSVVSSATMTANGDSGNVTVTVGEDVDFEVSGAGTCMNWPAFPGAGEGGPEPWEFSHDIFYGDGGSTTNTSWIVPETQFSRVYNSPGTYNVSDSISCGCNSLITLRSASQQVEAKNPPPAIVEVILTFDDGPTSAGDHNTRTVISTLKSNLIQSDIEATFFVQTHVPNRGGDPEGIATMEMALDDNHGIQIHNGWDTDDTPAAWHTVRAELAPYAGGANALESDLIRAKARIAALNGGSVPTMVRAVELRTNPKVFDTYERQNLVHKGIDVDSKDSRSGRTVASISAALAAGIASELAQGNRKIVVLFHDIHGITADNLELYLGEIAAAVALSGNFTVQFVNY